MQLVRLVSALVVLATLLHLDFAGAQYRLGPSRPVYRPNLAAQYIAYYGKDFYDELGRGSRNKQLKGLLRVIMTTNHVRVPNEFDEILVGGCEGKTGCYRHKVLGYNYARVFLMGYYYLVQTPRGYGIREMYCSRVYEQSEFGSEPPAPQKIPNGTVVNTEHTWPQSRFNHRLPDEEQKSDIHHLYPTDSQVNATRGNHEFGQVAQVTEKMRCAASKAGRSALGTQVFEPPAIHKGNVARALFYFSTRYDLPISPEEENTLKAWNKLDPVDQEEMQRNEAIYQAEGTRNPFVDYPDLADRITDF